MRTVETHKVNPCNDVLDIEVRDEPGIGGASHLYVVKGFDTTNNPSHGVVQGDRSMYILFQNGPIGEVGVNGITQEVLLAIVLDRLQSFQKGPYTCRENALAITKIEEAIHWLHHRTLGRVARGVEGTHKL